ncbi:hypothetical protein SARC_12798, partial [Sphaeroforma arctica JP610]
CGKCGAKGHKSGSCTATNLNCTTYNRTSHVQEVFNMRRNTHNYNYVGPTLASLRPGIKALHNPNNGFLIDGGAEVNLLHPNSRHLLTKIKTGTFPLLLADDSECIVHERGYLPQLGATYITPT